MPCIRPALGEQLAHQRAHPRQNEPRPIAHIRRLAVPRQHLEIRSQHGDFQAGGAHRDAEQHTEAAAQAKRLRAPTARCDLVTGLLQYPLLEHAGDGRIGSALRERRAHRQSLARDAARPEHMVEQGHLFGRQLCPADQFVSSASR